MRRILIGACSALFLMVGVVSAAVITDLNNTGGGAPGGADPNWDVDGSVCPPSAATCAPVGDPISGPAYIPLDSLIIPNIGGGALAWDSPSQWITPALRADGGVDNHAEFDGAVQLEFGTNLTTYTTTFNLEGTEAVSASISGLWWADGELDNTSPGLGSGPDACGIALNGICVYSDTSVFAATAFSIASEAAPWAVGTPFSITSGFDLDGINTLEFFVWNINNETGLRVDMEGQYNVIPEPSTYILIGGGLALAALVRRRRAA